MREAIPPQPHTSLWLYLTVELCGQDSKGKCREMFPSSSHAWGNDVTALVLCE
jgi:hypothetical protein